jgi:hypothetical protein
MRLSRFEEHRYVGDKRTQVVHDLDHCPDTEALDDLVQAETYLCFGPDTLAEARNRGYHLCRSCEKARRAAEVV